MTSACLEDWTSQITVTTDSNGFRTSTADAYNKKFKIFLVGGSTVEQIDLDDRKTTSASLERGIGNSDYSVINTGVSGLRTVNHVATINAIKRFEPYLIIIQLGVNDWGCALKTPARGRHLIRAIGALVLLRFQ